jgi:replicative DNA helicase
MPNPSSSSRTVSDAERVIIGKFIHSPEELASALPEYYDYLRAKGLLAWGIPILDQMLPPIRPTQVHTFLGRPGHGKTTFLAALAKNFSAQLIPFNQTSKRKRIVAVVTWQTIVDEYEVMLQTEGHFTVSEFHKLEMDRDALVTRALRRIDMPVWMLGDRIAGSRHTMEKMTFDRVEYALLHIQEFFGVDVEIAAIIGDYLQVAPLSGRYLNRTAEVSEAMYLFENLAKKMATTVFLGAQAGRKTDERNPPIPEAADSQHASDIEQVSAGLYGLWRPRKSRFKELKLGNGKALAVTPNLLVLQVEKGRLRDAAQQRIKLYMSPDMVNLEDLEVNYSGGLD